MLTCRQVSYSYNGQEPAVQDISLNLHPGETLGLTGPSGCGKSTLCHLILGLMSPQQGEIFFGDKPLTDLKRKRTIPRHIQLVMQNPETAFDPNKTMNYSLNELRHFLPIDKDLLAEDISRTLSLLELEAGMLPRRPEELSGGQLQRFAILRALLMKPKLLILDEVTSMLDTLVQAKIIHLLAHLKEKLGLSYLMVSHDRELLRHFSDRVLTMRRGQIIDERSNE